MVERSIANAPRQFIWANCDHKRRMHLIAPRSGIVQRAWCGDRVVVASYPNTLTKRPHCVRCQRANSNSHIRGGTSRGVKS